tara:strand:- start:469 stop:678 length:210 start_codon:yes stop_codon:yes gene_type:complete
MLPTERVEALRRKHMMISRQIETESKNPYVNERYVKMLKRQKLMLKEMIEGVRDQDNQGLHAVVTQAAE